MMTLAQRPDICEKRREKFNSGPKTERKKQYPAKYPERETEREGVGVEEL